MTLLSKQKIRNSSPGGLRTNTLPLVTEAPHNTEFLQVDGEETFFLNRREREPNPEL